MHKLLLILLAVVVSVTATAQMSASVSKYLSTDVSSLSEAQIKQIAQEINKRGYTMAQVKQLAKMQGASDTQITQMENRLKKYLNGGVATTKTAQELKNQDSPTDSDDDGLSPKAAFRPSPQDMLIFGFSLFNNEKLSFEPSVNIPVSENYILGPGDEILIDIWGLSQQSYQLTVTSTGSIEIPIVGPIYVTGMKFKDAKSAIESRLKSIYSDLGTRTSASIKTGQLRTISISVMGEVNAPGTYTVSGAASLFNVLYLSGGPNRNGSFRNIQLLRGGKIEATLDVYDFLLNGNSEVNVPLLDGDVVMIPTFQKRVAVGGEFKRIGYYEAIEGETVDDMVRYAGGFSPQALQSHIELYRVGQYGIEFKDVTESRSELLANGDSIAVGKINQLRFDNVVNISGGVFAPGNYEFTDGLKLSQLIERAGGLIENAFMNRGVITRLKDDYTLESLNFNVAELMQGKYDTDLRSNDSILIAEIDALRDMQNLTIIGAVRQPGIFVYRENITLGDLILLAGGLTADASPTNVEIVRRLPDAVADTSYFVANTSESITITKDLSLSDEGNSFALEPFDVVMIREYTAASARGQVTVTGEVRFAGVYELISKDETLATIINRAGGLTPSSAIEGARLYRRTALTEKEKIIKEQAALATNAKDALNFEKYELVAIDLADALKDGKSLDNITLRDGDEIVIPSTLQTVRASGNVLNPVSMVYVSGDKAKKTIQKAGGFAPRSRRSKTYVIHADGKAEPTKSFLFFRKYPKMYAGSEVVVPEKPQAQMTTAQTISIISSVVTMLVLIVSVL